MGCAKRLLCVAGFFSVLIFPALSSAQSATTGAIAGTARDTTGAVLPGVTVEAASPALIEKVRTAVTDDQGNYKIVDLRPGTYTVTFMLPGFATFKREGVELTTGFTALVNGDMRVGALEETVTVTGASPIVDVQNVRTQNVISRELLDTLPTAKGIQAMGALTLGATLGQGTQDVGGTSGTNAIGLSIHGSRANDSRLLQDGMSYNASFASGGNSYYYNLNTVGVQEMVLETSGMSAESETSGLQMNGVPKEGGNRFSVFGVAQYADENFSANNLTSELLGRGVRTQPTTRKVYDYGIGVGGPIRRDRLWFYSSNRLWGGQRYTPARFWNASSNPLFFVPGARAYSDNPLQDFGIRLTWQASTRHKFAFSENFQTSWNRDGVAEGGTATATTIVTSTPILRDYWGPLHLAQATWNYPRTNRLLLEARVSIGYFTRDTLQYPDVQPTTIAITEQTTGLAYGASGSVAGFGYGDDKAAHNIGQRVAVSYITGSHAFKTGLVLYEGIRNDFDAVNESIAYTFRDRVPISLTEFASPRAARSRALNLGLYAQDQWSLRKLTLNLGVRFDGVNGRTLAEDVPAGRFLPVQHFDAVENVPNFKDLLPRIGAALDVFGNGKTAIKGAIGRYVASEGTTIAASNHPANTMVRSATRTWTDANANYVPDCDLKSIAANGECGALSDTRFGTLRPNVRYSPDVTDGWRVRGYNWETSLVLQHELNARIGLNAGYFRRWFGNLTAIENEAVTPADFTPYCVAPPRDARLPGGGGSAQCGFYDVIPAKFGLVNQVVKQASDYGDMALTFDAIDISLSARFGARGQVIGGVSTGRWVRDACSTVDKPNVTLFQLSTSDRFAGAVDRRPGFCDVTTPWGAFTQVKVAGVYALPWGVGASVTFQNLPGIPTAATYTARNAEVVPSLGRNLAAGANATVAIPLIPLYTQFEARLSQLDLRFSKTVRVKGASLKGMFDIYNALNASTVLAVNNTYGPAWLTPTQVLSPRLFKVGAEVSF